MQTPRYELGVLSTIVIICLTIQLVSLTDAYVFTVYILIVIGEMSTSDVFKKFYVKLVKGLPMDDTLFRAELFANDLLPGDHKERVESLATKSDKAAYFLDHVIKPSVTSNDHGSSFDKLLSVMEDSEYQGVKELAKM